MKLNPQELSYYNSSRSESAHGMACWSPVKNLFVGMRGKIMTCCYYKSYVLGDYPGENLKDIWFGEKRRNLISKLKENDFSHGCQGCLEGIKAGNINGLTSRKFDHLPLNAKGYPTRMDFELSNECNLECVMCRGEFSSAIRRNVEKLPPIDSPYGSEFLKELEEFIPHLTACHFLGGEPFMIPIYQDIWEMMIRINPSIRISVVTNATLLSDRIKKIIEPIHFDIIVSIDSVDKSNYESIRRNARFEQVMENIHYLNNYCSRKKTRFNLSSCVMTTNAFELSNITQFANTLDCELFFTRVTYPRELSLETREASELEGIIKTIQTANLPVETERQQKNKTTLLNLASHLEFWKSQSVSSVKVESFAEYLQGLKDYLKVNSKDESLELYNNIEEKLNYLLEIAKQNNLSDQALKKIQEVPFKTLVEMVPGINKEHLLHLFQAYVMPIQN